MPSFLSVTWWIGAKLPSLLGESKEKELLTITHRLCLSAWIHSGQGNNISINLSLLAFCLCLIKLKRSFCAGAIEWTHLPVMNAFSTLHVPYLSWFPPFLLPLALLPHLSDHCYCHQRWESSSLHFMRAGQLEPSLWTHVSETLSGPSECQSLQFHPRKPHPRCRRTHKSCC